MELQYVVLTGVTRDDLSDGGASHYAAAVRAVRQRLPESGIEVLPSDLGGDHGAVATIIQAGPDVFNHNIETCRRLTPMIRSGADYDRSLDVLACAAELGGTRGILTKSGLLVGLGETDAEIRDVFADLRASGVAILTLGQYMPPSPEHRPLSRYVTPEEFAEWAECGRREFGFTEVVSGPLVRSSYGAAEAAGRARVSAAGVGTRHGSAG
jgi:lipoic acid synthetase